MDGKNGLFCRRLMATQESRTTLAAARPFGRDDDFAVAVGHALDFKRDLGIPRLAPHASLDVESTT